MDPKSVIEHAAKHGAKILDLRFIDVPGVWQHVSYPIQELTAESFQDGFGIDASSIRGWAQIHESDMLLIPDPNTAFIDPFRDTSTLVMICDAQDPISRKPYTRPSSAPKPSSSSSITCASIRASSTRITTST